METPIISVEKLVKKFGDFPAVNEVSFEVKKGEIFAFLGPNGAGKTTTIKMLTTLLLPTSGSININGFNPLTQQKEVRQSFGIVFQDPSLDDELTAEENLEFHGVLYGMPAQLRKQRAKELLEVVELYDRRRSFVKTFSGGMKRRLEIARGLLHHPAVLFLDEPTVGLDPQTRNHIWKYVQDLSQREHTTIFLTTHYMEEAEKVAQRIAIVDAGKIVAEGTAEALRTQTQTANLEEAFLALTGKAIREEASSNVDHLRMHVKMRGR